MVLHLNYDEAYYTLKEAEYGFAGLADRVKFVTYIRPSDRVLDFCSGGGAILSNIDCAEKLGIDPNPRSRGAAERIGIPVVAAIDDVPDGWADVVISNHALEHSEAPFDIIKALKRKMKADGRIVFVVPCESVTTAWDPANPHNHLYTWSPNNLGNLFRAAGFRVELCESYYHRWPPKYHLVQRIVGWKLFHTICRVHGRLFTNLAQAIVVARPERDVTKVMAPTVKVQDSIGRIEISA